MKIFLFLCTWAVIMQVQKCKDKSPATEPFMQNENTYAIVISFYSIGQGINSSAQEEYDRWLEQYMQQHSGQLLVEKYPWGREGEIDYCIQYAGLDKSAQKTFLEKTKAMLSKKENVRIEENAECVHKKWSK